MYTPYDGDVIATSRNDHRMVKVVMDITRLSLGFTIKRAMKISSRSMLGKARESSMLTLEGSHIPGIRTWKMPN